MVKLLEKIKKLPNSPGVYLFHNKNGRVIYVGKAAKLKTRVLSYFQNHDKRFQVAWLLEETKRISHIPTDSVAEATILEAQLIKKFWPKFNVFGKDDKSFYYVVITKEEFPKILLVRGGELNTKWVREKKKILKSFGPFTSASTIKKVLKILKKIFAWSNCQPPQKEGKPCFYYHLKQCPGICLGLVKSSDYRKEVIKPIILFFEGKKEKLSQELIKNMQSLAAKKEFEKAARLRDQIKILEKINDFSLLEQNDWPNFSSLESGSMKKISRIEGYDISNIFGKYAVGSMVVFKNGQPIKKHYRKFKIKTLSGINDFSMLREIILRRLAYLRGKNTQDESFKEVPDLILVDGGLGQVNEIKKVIQDFHLSLPVIGLAKGPKRRNDHFVGEENNLFLQKFIQENSSLLKQVRDEAHRFAINYHRHLRKKSIFPS